MEARFHGPLVERARAQFLAAVRPFEGHPSQPILTLYATRTVRGISTYPSGLLGSKANVLVPAVADGVATALLSVPSAGKRERRLQRMLQDRLMPEVGHLPSTGDTARDAPHLPRRWRSEPAVAAHADRLEDGPLSPFLAPELRAWLSDPARGELSPSLRLGMEAASLLHSWWRRYREHLHEVDPRDLLG